VGSAKSPDKAASSGKGLNGRVQSFVVRNVPIFSTRVSPKSAMKIVLFVCEENRFRSIMAEAIFNSEAPAGWAAESAGLRATGPVSSTATELLQSIGLKPTRTESRLLTNDLAEGAKRIVTFGCLEGLSSDMRKKAEDWPVPRTYGRPPAERVAVRDEIRRRVQDLISRLPALA
jgi:arsenate reductase (thioredoxin)